MSCPQKAVDCESCPRINGRAWKGCPRINGRAFTHKWSRPYIEPVFPVANTPVVRAAPFGDKSATCPPTGLHPPPTATQRKRKKSMNKTTTLDSNTTSEARVSFAEADGTAEKTGKKQAAADRRAFFAPVGYRRLTINLPQALHKKLKLTAVEQDCTATEIIERLLVKELLGK